MHELKPKVIATLLASNNETIVGEAVRSVIHFVDELLLIDTGISDSTLSIVAEIAGPKFRLETFAWLGDFSAARNAALAFAEDHKGTWAVTLDTDEQVLFEGICSRDDLLLALEHDRSIKIWMAMKQDGTYTKDRFIKLPTTLRWEGRTHEALIGALKSETKILPGVTFAELEKGGDQLKQKLERDLPILLEATRNNPDDGRAWYYLGQTYDGLNERKSAIEAYVQAANRSLWSEMAAWSFYCAAKCSSDAHEYARAIEFCTRGLAKQSGTPELAWLAAWCSFQLRAFHNAVHWAHIAIALGNVDGINASSQRISFRYPPALYEAPYDVLRFAYRALGDDALAAQAHEGYELALMLRTNSISRNTSISAN